MTIISWFSCGVPSAVATKIALQNYPDVRIVYIKINSAHQDNERFISNCEEWYGKKIEIIQSDRYLDQFDVISQTGYINSPYGARCTTELKKKLRFQIEKTIDFSGQIFAFTNEKKELKRAANFKITYFDSLPLFPLIDQGLSKQDCFNIIKLANIELPAMYKLGFPNNNCIGCVKGGMGYWNLVRIHFPNHFDRMVDLEIKTGKSCINGLFLKDLNPSAGRNKPVYVESCGLNCVTND